MIAPADLSARLGRVDAGIADAARACGRDPASITRIVITKFHPAALVAQLHALGVADVGENRQQELAAKRTAVPIPELRWHFVGQVQTNKARAVRRDADVVHSVDRPRLADALDGAAPDDTRRLDVLIQVNLADDPSRGGVAPAGIEELAEHILARCPTLTLRGVMAVAPLGEPPAAAFGRLAESAARLRAVHPAAGWISAGMSGDFPEAIAAGATHLRIGSAITGPRPARG